VFQQALQKVTAISMRKAADTLQSFQTQGTPMLASTGGTCIEHEQHQQ
jgi:hypothetical protein